MQSNKPQREQVGLPPRTFLYTIDQIAYMLNIKESDIRRTYLYYAGRSFGSRPRDVMWAVNIAQADDPPDWRVAEREFTRWMRLKGYRFYDRGQIS